jgi:hypothetical protein
MPLGMAGQANQSQNDSRRGRIFPGEPRRISASQKTSISQQGQGDRQMVTFLPKPNAVPATEAAEESRFDRIRRIAGDRHKKSDAGTIRPDPPKAGDKRPM